MAILYYDGTHENIIHSWSLIKIAPSIFFCFLQLFVKNKKNNKYISVWRRPSSRLIMTGLYFTQFNFSDELQKVLIAFGFAFHKAESFPTVHEGNWNRFPTFHIYNIIIKMPQNLHEINANVIINVIIRFSFYMLWECDARIRSKREGLRVLHTWN